MDAAKRRICPAIVTMLLLVIAAMAYEFVDTGSTEKVEDGRVAIVLAPQERALMLREMRNFVAGLDPAAGGRSSCNRAEIGQHPPPGPRSSWSSSSARRAIARAFS